MVTNSVREMIGLNVNLIFVLLFVKQSNQAGTH